MTTTQWVESADDEDGPMLYDISQDEELLHICR